MRNSNSHPILSADPSPEEVKAIAALRKYRALRDEDREITQRGYTNGNAWELEAARERAADLMADLLG